MRTLPNKIEEAKKVSRQDMAFCLSRRAGTEQIVFGSSDAQLYELDLAAEKPEAVAFESGGDGEGHSSYITGLARVGDDDLLVSGAYDRRLIWWNAATRSRIRQTTDAHAKWIRKVVASPDSKLIASVADDMICRLWNAETGTLVRELKGHEAKTPHHYPSMLFTCAFSPDGELLATADKVGHIVIWKVADGSIAKTLEAPTMYTWDPKARRHSIGGVRALAFSPDGSQLTAGGIGKIGNIDHLGGKARLRTFAWEKGETLAEMESDEVQGMVERIHYHPEEKWLLALGGDHKGLAMIVDTTTHKIVTESRTPANHAHDFVFNDSADRIYVAGHNQVTVHDLRTS
jgi:WD40 repeat protein